MRGWIGAAALLLTIARPAAAQRRDLPVPTDKGWQHAQTGVVLTATLLGLPRAKLTDYGTQERDVAAQFNDPAVATSLTIFIFRPALQSAPLWFDRAAAQIAMRDVYGGAMATTPPTPFTRPGGTVAAGLRQTFAPAKGPYRSTALAVTPLGDWLVVVRLSSTTLTPAAMGAQLDAALAAIRWPRQTAAADGPAAMPLAACATQLATRRAKPLKATMDDAILGGLFGGLLPAAAGGSAETGALCRDGNPSLDYGMYRAPEATNGYTLAIADAGRVVQVAPGMDLPNLKTTRGYAVTYRDVDGSVSTFPAFDRLPLPEQVMKLVLEGKPVSRTVPKADGGSDVQIGVPVK